MDILNHGVQGFILGYMITGNVPVSIGSGIVATIPDLAILKNDNGKLYDEIHQADHWLSFLPFISMHILFDWFLHTDGKRWWVWKERMWVEILTWIINLIIIYFLFR